MQSVSDIRRSVNRTVFDNPVNYRRTVTSQWGEDGILEEIFERIGTRNKYCIEFGAWDGKHLSNTWNLWHNEGWSALLIEGNQERIESLESNTRGYQRVVIHKDYVSTDGASSLDSIFSTVSVPRSPDLLSIDVDGDDYHILHSLTKFSPRVVVVEYNPTVPPHIDLVQEPGEYFGASAAALVRLARSKDYKLVCCTQTNCFFVLSSEFKLLGISEPSLNEAFPLDNLTYVVTAQDGQPFLTRRPTYSNLDTTSLSKSLAMQQVTPDGFPRLRSSQKMIPIIFNLPRKTALLSKNGIRELWKRIGSK